MTSQELRRSFLDFFKDKGHTVVPSLPVIPHGDPTLYFTNAGMNQFKDVFLGTGSRDYSRAVDTQKCIRVSGKHNDLEEVGHDTYHHTLFEMLGNWSFGDYYKEEAISWAWELLTGVWGVDPKRLHVTVYRADDGSEQDDEAYEIWKKQPGLGPDHIHWFGVEDNFWEMGETGPCGPCSEIHFDRTADLSGGPLVNVGVQDVIEIWNLVFIQFNCDAEGKLHELPAKHVDTGMGFERVCAVMQGVQSNYDTDVFTPLLRAIGEIAGSEYTGSIDEKKDIAMRVIADHVRALSFAIADGAVPGNTGRGYVLRRILRRAVKYAFLDLDVKEPLLYKLVPTLVETMGETFPEIVKQQEYIEKIIKAEEEGFLETLEHGVKEFTSRIHDGRITDADAFMLYDTFGFPLDLTVLMAREQGMTVDVEGFNKLMEEQKQRARDARKSVSQEVSDLQIDGSTEFVGYTEEEIEAFVLKVVEGGVVLDKTPFYAEMGGQVADTGEIVVGGEHYRIDDVRKVGDAFVHIVVDDVEVKKGESVHAEIDHDRRAAIERNHSATHILHEALRWVLGDHVQQAGSLVAPDHLRFDFNHFSKVSEEELRDIESLVNEKIREAIAVETEEMAFDEARKIPNVKMFFGDKYGSEVRVVTIDPDFSREFCGGTHVDNSAEIGLLKLTSEESIQSGVRRVNAVTGLTADELLIGRYTEIERLSHLLNVTDRELYRRIEELLEEKKNLEKELAKLRQEEAAGGLGAILAKPVEGNGVKIVSGRVNVSNIDSLKELGDKLREGLSGMGGGIGLLGTEIDGKAMLVCVVTDNLTRDYPAGKIVGAAAKQLGGGGGGKPHMATAGGKDVSKLDEVLDGVKELVE
ncbi:MAG: alanine--tRNA ligase [Chlorobi bacterium]|nr:alanine--tRNA ligase [Chlorobiota bacterium]